MSAQNNCYRLCMSKKKGRFRVSEQNNCYRFCMSTKIKTSHVRTKQIVIGFVCKTKKRKVSQNQNKTICYRFLYVNKTTTGLHARTKQLLKALYVKKPNTYLTPFVTVLCIVFLFSMLSI